MNDVNNNSTDAATPVNYDGENVQLIKSKGDELQSLIESMKDADPALAAKAIMELQSAVYFAVKLAGKAGA